MTASLAESLSGTAMPEVVIDPSAPPVACIALQLRPWPLPVTDWRVAYGKNANLVVGADQTMSCVEAEVVRRLRASKYQAIWIDNFGAAPEAWRWAAGRDQSLPAEVLQRHLRMKAQVRQQRGKGGGCWDVERPRPW